MKKRMKILRRTDNVDDSSNSSDSDDNEDEDDDELEIPQRVACFAHTLQLCVKDGLKASSTISAVLRKAGRVVSHCRKSTLATEKVEELFGKTVIAKNETRWNSQLKMVRRLVEIDVDKVVDKREFQLNAYEKVVLRELVEVFEPFEEATDILQGDKYSSISLVIPCFLGLKRHLSQLSTRHSSQIIRALQASLDHRLGHTSDEPLYVCGAILDPRFKLTWSTEIEKHQKMFQAEVSKLTLESDAVSSDEEPQPKKSKLFSFMVVHSSHKKTNSYEQEFQLYLRDGFHCENPLEFWHLKATEYTLLAKLASKVFTVPATSAPVERVFSQAGKILNPLRCRMLPKNLETLLFLKMNSHFM